MNLRERILSVLLGVSGGIFTTGVALFDERAAWLVGAPLLAAWSWITLAGDDE